MKRETISESLLCYHFPVHIVSACPPEHFLHGRLWALGFLWRLESARISDIQIGSAQEVTQPRSSNLVPLMKWLWCMFYTGSQSFWAPLPRPVTWTTTPFISFLFPYLTLPFFYWCFLEFFKLIHNCFIYLL